MKYFGLRTLGVTLVLVVSLFAAKDNAGGEPGTVTFALTGDIMLGTDFPDTARKIPPEDGRRLFESVAPYLRAADCAIGNLEAPVTAADSCAKTMVDSVVYAFRTPPPLAHRLAEAGFDVLSTANNHANDFGHPGRTETDSLLCALDIAVTGRTGQVAEVMVRGIPVGVAGFSVTKGSNSLLEPDRAAALISDLASRCDIVVVTFHGGGEGADYLHVPDGPEMFKDEERGDLRAFVRAAIDAGADIVFGHGPHVPRGVEVYKGRLAAYSLGNFCTWFGINVQKENGLAPLLLVDVDPTGALRSFEILSFEQSSRHYPRPDPHNRAFRLMVELSEADFGGFPHTYLRASGR